MSNIKLLFVAVSIALMVMSSCSKKVVQPVIDVNNPSTVNMTSSATVVTKYIQPEWSSFKSGGNAIIEAGGKSTGSSMQMRMQRGKSIYVSLRPLMGIEVAKMVIYGDSILLVDKVHKRYMLEKASLLTNGVPVTVDNLQDIFLGRAFELGKGSLNPNIKDDFIVENVEGGKVVLKPRDMFQGFEYNFVYDKSNNMLSLNVIPTKEGESSYSVAYDNVKGTVAGKVPTSLRVSTTMRGRAFTLSLDYNDMKWNEDFTIDTAEPKKYTRVEGGDIMLLLGGGK